MHVSEVQAAVRDAGQWTVPEVATLGFILLKKCPLSGHGRLSSHQVNFVSDRQVCSEHEI
jgi:hypothetical protein